MGEGEVKKVRINLQTRSGSRQLERLLNDGWEISEQSPQDTSQGGGETDIVLTRTKQALPAGTPEPEGPEQKEQEAKEPEAEEPEAEEPEPEGPEQKEQEAEEPETEEPEADTAQGLSEGVPLPSRSARHTKTSGSPARGLALGNRKLWLGVVAALVVLSLLIWGIVKLVDAGSTGVKTPKPGPGAVEEWSLDTESECLGSSARDAINDGYRVAVVYSDSGAQVPSEDYGLVRVDFQNQQGDLIIFKVTRDPACSGGTVEDPAEDGGGDSN